jgi:hypothetical protein
MKVLRHLRTANLNAPEILRECPKSSSQASRRRFSHFLLSLRIDSVGNVAEPYVIIPQIFEPRRCRAILPRFVRSKVLSWSFPHLELRRRSTVRSSFLSRLLHTALS